MLKILVLLLSVMLWSCGKANDQKVEAGQQQSQTAEKGLVSGPKEKSEELKRIDEQAALINILVSTPDEYCSTERRINKLSSLVTTEEGKQYANTKSTEMLARIESKAKEIVDEYWEKNLDKNEPSQVVQGTVELEFKKKNKFVTVVSANYIDKETHYEKNNRKRITKYNFLYTMKEDTGILSSDNFYSVKAYCEATYIMNCEEGSIGTGGYITSITKTNK